MHEPDFGRNGRVIPCGRKDLDYEVSCSGLRASTGPCTFFPVYMTKFLPSQQEARLIYFYFTFGSTSSDEFSLVTF